MKRLFFLLILFVSFNLSAQVSTFKLSNGLTVIINEDHRTPSVFGCIVVKAGSVDEPSDATGLAHYLEHMMFKGSQNVGTTNWEKEKEHYQKIIDLYDQLSVVPVDQRGSIQQKINEESLLAGNYTINNEFSNLIQSIGGTSLNAATGYDMTYYYNVLPSFQIKKWLELQYDRFANPVFRGFQAELETVYEEKNMYSDNWFQTLFEEFPREIYGSSNPYSRSIIGTTEHLKTPSLRKLIEFYETFYVPSNMALVLSGDVKSSEIQSLLESTLGQWSSKKDVQRAPIGEPTITQSKTVKKKLTPNPILMIGYKGIASNSEDSYKLAVLEGVLSNRNQTGMLDKLTLDGDVQDILLRVTSQRHSGIVSILGIPIFDKSQLRYTSLTKVESNFKRVLDQLKAGEIEEWLIQSVKDDILMSFELSKESNLNYGMMLVQAFGADESIEDIEKFSEKIKVVSKQDVVDIAKKLFDAPSLSVHSLIGDPAKDKISKPDYKPIVPVTGQISAFASKWLNEPIEVPAFKPIDFSKDFTKAELAPSVTLFHTPNPDNSIFTLTIKYGVGSSTIPELDFSVDLMNMAGVMAQFTPYELKKEFSNLGCMVSFANDRNNTYVILRGKESSLAKACQLLSKTFLMPSIDEKQISSLIGRELGSRYYEAKNKDAQSSALNEYIKYGENSRYLTRFSNMQVLELTLSKLAAGFIKATQYETSVHYTGRYSFDVVKNVLNKNLAFPSNLKPSISIESTPLVEHKQNSIFIINNKGVRQSDIFLYLPGVDYQIDQKPRIDAFNQYFAGGFSGLVLQELRELRSFAYTASAYYSIPMISNRKSIFSGYIGTQGDKTFDAVSQFMLLIKEMPQYPDRIENIKDYLNQATVSASPSVRQKTMVVENWMMYGYVNDPRINWVDEYAKLTFDDIVEFYNERLKDKPIAVAIITDSKFIDKKKMKTLGRVVNLDTKKIFKY